MIEINLSPTKGTGDKLNVGGFDLSNLNVKMLILSILFLYIPESFLLSYYETEITALTASENQARQSLRSLNNKVKSLDNIKKQVDALKDQELKLAERLKTVKVIINKRQNPFKLLNYLVENIPKALWLTSLKIDNQKMVLLGYADNWKDIGVFLESLKNSIFLTKIEYTLPEGVKTDYNGRKVEVFKISADILRFK